MMMIAGISSLNQIPGSVCVAPVVQRTYVCT